MRKRRMLLLFISRSRPWDSPLIVSYQLIYFHCNQNIIPLLRPLHDSFDKTCIEIGKNSELPWNFACVTRLQVYCSGESIISNDNKRSRRESYLYCTQFKIVDNFNDHENDNHKKFCAISHFRHSYFGIKTVEMPNKCISFTSAPVLWIKIDFNILKMKFLLVVLAAVAFADVSSSTL